MWVLFPIVALAVLLSIKHAPSKHPRSIRKHDRRKKGWMWE